MDVPEDNYDANRLSLLLKTGGKVVKDARTQLNDALNESWTADFI